LDWKEFGKNAPGAPLPYGKFSLFSPDIKTLLGHWQESSAQEEMDINVDVEKAQADERDADFERQVIADEREMENEAFIGEQVAHGVPRAPEEEEEEPTTPAPRRRSPRGVGNFLDRVEKSARPDEDEVKTIRELLKNRALPDEVRARVVAVAKKFGIHKKGRLISLKKPPQSPAKAKERRFAKRATDVPPLEPITATPVQFVGKGKKRQATATPVQFLGTGKKRRK
jgi:hypothetical protein